MSTSRFSWRNDKKTIKIIVVCVYLNPGLLTLRFWYLESFLGKAPSISSILIVYYLLRRLRSVITRWATMLWFRNFYCFLSNFPVLGTLKSSYKFVRIFPLFYCTFSFFYQTFSTQKKANISFPFYWSFSPSSLFSFHVSTFIFLLIIDNLCKRRNYSDFHYNAQLWNNISNFIFGNLNI